MVDADSDRTRAALLPKGDVIGVLFAQHARIRDLFDDIRASEGEHKRHAFDELRALLAVHETSEEMVLRPVSRHTAGAEISSARNQEEAEANRALTTLERMDVTVPEFGPKLAEFENLLLSHCDREEREEFPTVLMDKNEDERRAMGRRLQAAERFAPTHPHPGAGGTPTTQWAIGPFVGIVEKVRETIRATR
jgi:hypothetical protein